MTAEQVTKLLDVHTLSLELDPSLGNVVAGVVVARRVLGRHEAAKKLLIAQGRPKELVDAMPHLQVAMLDAFLQYDQLFDDAVKWQSLPFWEALPGMEKARADEAKTLDVKSGPAIPIARLLLPATDKMVSSRGASTAASPPSAALRPCASMPPPTTASCRRPWTKSRTFLYPSIPSTASRSIIASPATGRTYRARPSPASRPTTRTRRRMNSL